MHDSVFMHDSVAHYSQALEYPDYDYDFTESDYSSYPEEEESADYPNSCPSSLQECVASCSPVLAIQQIAYKLCVNECLDRCT